MPVYEYHSVDDQGNASVGRMEEPSAKHVAALLHERGLQASAIEEVNRARGFLPSKRPLGAQDIALLNEQLLAIIKDGLPLAPALKTMASDLRDPRVRRVLEKVHQDLEQGDTLEEAFARHPESFSPVYLSLIRAGEQSGNFQGVLELLVAEGHRKVEMRKRLVEVFAYPFFIIIVAYYLMIFMMVSLIPTFAEVFYDIGATMPWLTGFWASISVIVRNHLLFFAVLPIIVVFLVMAGYWYGRRAARFGLVLDRIKDFVPGVGRVNRSRVLARFSRTLGLMLASRVPIIEALDLAAAASGDYALRHAVRNATRDIVNGSSVSDALEETRYFNNTFCWMLGNAERRGDLSETLLRLAEIHEREAQRMERWATTIIAPILILFVGFIVFTIALSMYVPLYTLADGLSG